MSTITSKNEGDYRCLPQGVLGLLVGLFLWSLLERLSPVVVVNAGLVC